MMGLSEIIRRQGENSGSFGDGSSGTISTGNTGTDLFLSLIADPFQSSLQQTSFYAALIYSFGVGFLLVLLFCFLRPRVQWTYAPRAKYADSKHAPPPVGKGFFSWFDTVKIVKEQELVDKIGLDATIFLRFLRMSRNIFLILSVIGCGVLIPVNLVGTHLEPPGGYSATAVFVRLTPQYIYGNKFWAYVVVAYVMTGVIFFFLWSNYKAITALRRTYLESQDYQNSLHSRTLLITHVPQSLRTNDGLVQITREGKALDEIPSTAIARNVKELPELIEEHDQAVQKLEEVLAAYLANPDKLPQKRPLCKPFKQDMAHQHGHKVDAIDYLTARIQQLEFQITQVRETVDKRNPLPYGFASYHRIEDAHSVAYATKKKAPQETTIKLAPKPHDLIWKNLPLTRAQRRTKSAWMTFWMVLLTILYIPPNVLTAVFLVNLHNLGQLWSGFGTQLEAHPVGWAIAQGIIAPGIQILFYLFLPTIFRRFLIRAGDTTKTARERHVLSKLYVFFVFNNLFVFSIFATAWALLATIIQAQNKNIWDTIKEGHIGSKIVISLSNISPYWITWQLQRNLGAAIDIVQAWPLIYNWIRKKMTNPTPRQLVELTAPQPFEYADYYNQYLYTATVGLCYGTIQPLILPVTALYIGLDFYLKKYMLQYIFITKVESGGAFWRVVFNRFLFATLFMNAIIALVVGSQGYANPMLFVMVPLLPILAAFKWYCSRTFDAEYNYYTVRSFSETETGRPAVRTANLADRKRLSADRVGVKFGNPALYKRLKVPMVHEKSKRLLQNIYRSRLDDNETEFSMATKTSRPNSAFGFSDIYMSSMDAQKPGKTSNKTPFEVVPAADLDFENFKRRADFRDEFGGDGELYGRPEDLTRPGTPSSMMSFGASTLIGGRNSDPRSRSESPHEGRAPGHVYHAGYATVPPRGHEHSPSRAASPAGYRSSGSRPATARLDSIDIPTPGLQRGEISEAGHEAYAEDENLFRYESRRMSQGSMGGMIDNAQRMGRSGSPGARIARKPLANTPSAGRLSQSYRYADGSGAGMGLMGTPDGEGEEQTSYDYFRRGRSGPY